MTRIKKRDEKAANVIYVVSEWLEMYVLDKRIRSIEDIAIHCAACIVPGIQHADNIFDLTVFYAIR